MITVLLVEDHASFRQALQAVMRSTKDLQVVAQTDRGDAAAQLAAEHRPTVAIVDLDLPGASGITAVDAIRDTNPETRCVVLTALTDDAELGRAIEAGAAAVVHKATEIPALLDIIRTVARGGSVLPPGDTSRRLRALAMRREREWHARALADVLSDREREVLALLTNGLGNAEIGKRLGISPQTVQTHVRNLHAKLGVGSRLEAVTKALRLGLVSPPVGGGSGREVPEIE